MNMIQPQQLHCPSEQRTKNDVIRFIISRASYWESGVIHAYDTGHCDCDITHLCAMSVGHQIFLLLCIVYCVLG